MNEVKMTRWGNELIREKILLRDMVKDFRTCERLDVFQNLNIDPMVAPGHTETFYSINLVAGSGADKTLIPIITTKAKEYWKFDSIKLYQQSKAMPHIDLVNHPVDMRYSVMAALEIVETNSFQKGASKNFIMLQLIVNRHGDILSCFSGNSEKETCLAMGKNILTNGDKEQYCS